MKSGRDSMFYAGFADAAEGVDELGVVGLHRGDLVHRGEQVVRAYEQRVDPGNRADLLAILYGIDVLRLNDQIRLAEGRPAW